MCWIAVGSADRVDEVDSFGGARAETGGIPVSKLENGSKQMRLAIAPAAAPLTGVTTVCAAFTWLTHS